MKHLPKWIHLPIMIHFSNNDTLTKGNNDTLTKGRYTYQREIHLPKGDTLIKGRYTYQMEIHFSNNDTLFE